MSSDRPGALITSLGSLFQGPGHPLCEEPFPRVPSECPLTQLHSLSLCPVAGHQREEISSSPSCFASREEAVDCDEGTAYNSCPTLQLLGKLHHI